MGEGGGEACSVIRGERELPFINVIVLFLLPTCKAAVSQV